MRDTGHNGTHEYWLYGDSEQVANKLEELHGDWFAGKGNAFKQMWIRNYIAYYSPVLHPSSHDTSLIFEGIQGELTRFYTPKARTLIRQLTSIVTKQRMAFKASARTTGAEVLNEVKLGNALADQIVSLERLDLKGDQLCEGALVTGAWFTKSVWRTDLGQPYTRDPKGKIITTGAVDITLHSPFNVFYNMLLPWDEIPWCEVKVKRNRWDLIADHPDLEEEIKALPSVAESRSPNSWVDTRIGDEDLVHVYEFFHKPTPSLPKGRMLIYGDSQTVFHDDINPYGAIPVEPNMPETVLDTGMGYAKLTDLSGCQEMFDNSLSSIATNQAQWAVQTVANPRGSNINVTELNGMRYMSYTPQNIPGGGLPTPLQLTKTAPETFKFTDQLGELMQDMSLLNGAMTGNLPPGVSSGTAIATLSANSIEFITSISKSYNLCWEKTMMHAINAYAKFAKIPQPVKLTQKGGQETHKEFKGDDIQNISGMVLETVNPLMKTFAGRLEIGEKLITIPRDIWPEYVSILEGRPLDEVYKGELTVGDLITQENEVLEAGEPTPVLATDDHPVHIQKHADCLSDIGVRTNGKAVKVLLEHILEHYQQIKQGDPALMGIMKTGRIPEGGLPPQGGPPPGGPGGGPKPLAGPPPGAMDKPQPGADRPGKPPPMSIAQPDVATPAPDALQRQGGLG